MVHLKPTKNQKTKVYYKDIIYYGLNVVTGIRDQPIFAWVGVSFENSDGGGGNFFQHGGSLGGVMNFRA